MRACSKAGGNGARHQVPPRGSAAPVRFWSAQPSSRGCGWQGPGRSLRWWMTRHARGVDPSGGRGRSRHPFGTGTSVEGTRQVTTATPAMLVFFERTERARSPREPTVETATPSTVKAACAAPAARPLIGRPLGQAVDDTRLGGRARLASQWPGSPATARVDRQGCRLRYLDWAGIGPSRPCEAPACGPIDGVDE
jgi:hypothetical protein